MTYHDLSECTLSDYERFCEKNEILKMLDGKVESWKFEDKEWEFISKMNHAAHVSVRQLFWLRDIKDKYLDKE